MLQRVQVKILGLHCSHEQCIHRQPASLVAVVEGELELRASARREQEIWIGAACTSLAKRVKAVHLHLDYSSLLRVIDGRVQLTRSFLSLEPLLISTR